MKRLESKCWDAMMNPESPLYEPQLAVLFKGGKKANKKACCGQTNDNWLNMKEIKH